MFKRRKNKDLQLTDKEAKNLLRSIISQKKDRPENSNYDDRWNSRYDNRKR